MICELRAQDMMCAFLFLLAGEIENELDFSLYSLSSKTSCYAHFGDKWLTIYGHPVSRLMLLLHPKFEFLNIRYAAYEIQIAVYVPEAYCPNSVYRLSGSG